MNYLEEFDDVYTQIDSKLSIYVRVSQLVLTNQFLKELLSIILRMGNFLNTNNYKGNTSGFNISSLEELQALKSAKTSVTSLHFIVEQFEKNHKSDQETAFSFLSELKEIGVVLGHGSANLQSDFRQLKKSVTDFTEQIEGPNTPAEVRSQYASTFGGFVARTARLCDAFKVLDRARCEIVGAYGEDELTFSLDSFLRIFYEFANNVVRAREV